jgi:hypothetical protein
MASRWRWLAAPRRPESRSTERRLPRKIDHVPSCPHLHRDVPSRRESGWAEIRGSALWLRPGALLDRVPLIRLSGDPPSIASDRADQSQMVLSICNQCRCSEVRSRDVNAGSTRATASGWGRGGDCDYGGGSAPARTLPPFAQAPVVIRQAHPRRPSAQQPAAGSRVRALLRAMPGEPCGPTRVAEQAAQQRGETPAVPTTPSLD